MPINSYICPRLIIYVIMDSLQLHINALKRAIKEKAGRSMDSPGDYDFLSLEVKKATNEYISPTTLKRFFNYIQSNVSTRTSTLSLLSRYLGYKGWDDFKSSMSVSQNSLPKGSEQHNSSLSTIDDVHSEITENRIRIVKHSNYYTIVIPKKSTWALYLILLFVASLLFCVGTLFTNISGRENIKEAGVEYSLIDDGQGGKISSIELFDTLSKIVLEHTNTECAMIKAKIDSLPTFKEKNHLLRQWHRNNKIHADEFPTIVMGRYLNGDEPEYNLYRISLINAANSVYEQFYTKMNDSVMVAIVKETEARRAAK